MDTQREQVAEALLTAAIVSAGFATGNPVITSVVGGIGVNWAADLTQEAWGHACRRLLGESGLLNHDLQQAMVRSFQQAIAHLEDAWWKTNRGHQMRHAEPEAARLADQAFAMLRQDAEAFCTPDRLGRTAGNQQVRQLLYGDEAAARAALSQHLASYLHGHDSQLVQFVERHLVQELAFWFGEELKADRPASNRAWRAFQRWLLEGLRASLAEVRAEQQETNRVLAELQAWARRMEVRPPEERESTGQAALEQALMGVRDELLDAMAREHGLTRATIDAGLEQIAAGLAEVRADLETLPEHIRSIFHEEFLAAHPVGGSQRLQDAYIKPWSVFERVGLEHFTGRDWLADEIDAFLERNDRGHFILEAKAGLGKTTFLAYLVQDRNYIHHFVGSETRSYRIADSLRNLAAQVIRAWGLDRYDVDGVLPDGASRPDFFQDLLLEAARRRDEISPGEKIVLVVDALDEAEIVPGGNVLGLPKVLPQGVYFIVSQRPVDVPLQVDGPRSVFRLEAANERNLDDMREYLEHATTWQGISQALQESDYSTKQFVDILLEKCQGVWIYLHYVVDEIERGKRSPLDLNSLPHGVWRYYAQFWQSWQEQSADDWDKVHLPLLSTLAAVQEAVALEFLCTLAGVEEQPALRRLLEGPWRPFLAVEGGVESRYQLYHASIREFLDGRADLAEMTTAEQDQARELAKATRLAHARIADRYLDTWGGLEAGLPELQDPAKRDMDDRYGLRHLAAHLEKAGRVDDLHHLLRVEWYYEEEEPYYFPRWSGLLNSLLCRLRPRTRQRVDNAWYTVHEQGQDISGYLRDVDHAWRLAEEVSNDRIQGEESATSVGLEVRYALIAASLNSLAGNIPASLLVAAVKAGIWHPSRALVHARQVPHALQRAEALGKLAPYVSEVERTRVLGEALNAARAQMSKIRLRDELLIELAPQMAEASYLEEVVDIMRRGGSSHVKTELFSGLTFRLLESGYPEEALMVAQTIPAALGRDELLDELLYKLESRLLELGYPEQALHAALANEREWGRARALSRLAPNLSEASLKQALDAADNMEDGYCRDRALVGLLPRLAELGYLQEARDRAREIQHDDTKVQGLAGLIPHLPQAEQRQALQEALNITQAIRNNDNQVRGLITLAPHLPMAERVQVLQEALATAHIRERLQLSMDTLMELVSQVSQLPEVERTPLIQQILDAVRATQNDSDRMRELVAVAPYVPKPTQKQILQEALDLARLHATEEFTTFAFQLANWGIFSKARGRAFKSP